MSQNYVITVDYRQNRLLVEALCNYMTLRALGGAHLEDLTNDELLEQAAKQYVEDRYSHQEESFRQRKQADKVEDFKALRGLFIALREAKPTNSLENSA